METTRADASGTFRSVDTSPAVRPETAVVAAEAEVIADDLEPWFGQVSRWWVGEVPGLGVMRLPLP
ncbi:hypothetical protein [Actinoplanes philippinensis]|uniref:hypothetical protein n=1 Tax=Actinoplanes philippinensis TaxID=35752 RepID=UPI0011606D11|nr:hypothetical protein [Actinoplanes philippinensis]